MKKLQILELSSALSLLISKLFLAFEMVSGWPFSVAGYVFVALYNFLRKDTLLAVTVVGLASISGYGWYKWTIGLEGLQTIDWIILVLTGVFALTIYVVKARKGGLMGHLQGVITLSVISAFVFLGFKIYLYGWVCLIVSHILLAYFYSRREARYYVVLQIISVVIAAIKIYSLF